MMVLKFIAMAMWILATGSYLWLMDKVEPESLIADWGIFILTLFLAAGAGDILFKLWRVPWHRSHWGELVGLGILFLLGIIVILLGVFLSALNGLGGVWPGFVIALLGILYFNWVVIRIEEKFKRLST